MSLKYRGSIGITGILLATTFAANGQQDGPARVIVVSPDTGALERGTTVGSLDQVIRSIPPPGSEERGRTLVFPDLTTKPKLADPSNPRGQPIAEEVVKSQEEYIKRLSKEERIRFEEFRRSMIGQDACFNAAEAFRRELENIEGKTEDGENARDQLLLLAKRYEIQCLAGPQEDGPANPSNKKVLRERIGVLATSRGAFCSAYLWSPSHLITARHCFYTLVETPRPDIPSVSDGNVYFQRLSEPGTNYEVQRIVEPSGLSLVPLSDIKTRVDFVYLKLINDIATAERAPPIADAQAWTPSFIAGYFPYASPISDSGSALPAVDSIRWARAGCAVVRTSGACLYHACQTVQGFSGAPVFSLRDGNVEFAGIHTEANGRSGECVVTGNSTGNIGVSAGRIRIYPPAN
jgi:hypothetical protein